MVIDDEKKILPSTMVTKQFKSFTMVISNQNQLNWSTNSHNTCSYERFSLFLHLLSTPELDFTYYDYLNYV